MQVNPRKANEDRSHRFRLIKYFLSSPSAMQAKIQHGVSDFVVPSLLTPPSSKPSAQFQHASRHGLGKWCSSMILEVWHTCSLVGTIVKLDNHSKGWCVSNFLQILPCTIQPSNSAFGQQIITQARGTCNFLWRSASKAVDLNVLTSHSRLVVVQLSLQ